MDNQKEEEKYQSEKISQEPDKIYIDLKNGVPTQPIESLCMNCEEQGVTKFMLTKIPFFKEIMLSSFQCDHCGFKNSEVQFAGKLEDYGVKYEVNVINSVAFNRTVVKSEFATIKVPEAGLEIPPETQKGSIKTIEGYFMSTVEGLLELQEERRKFDPVTAQKIDDYCQTLKEYASGTKMPFTFIVEDPSGNSFVQNPSAPTADQYCKKSHWIRSAEEYAIMGYPADQASLMAEEDRLKLKQQQEEGNDIKKYFQGKKGIAQTKEEQEKLLQKASAYAKRTDANAVTEAGFVDFSKSVDDQLQRSDLQEDDVRKMVLKFATPCYNCEKAGNVQMCMSSIPFFKEIIIMAFSCDFCGYRNSEIKEGGGMGEKAKRITLKVDSPEDLNRDVFKSDYSKFLIPELGFDMQAGSMGSMYTTVEGLLAKVIEELDKNNPFGKGDSATNDQYIKFIGQLQEMKDGHKPFTLVLDDPSDNCFIYNPFAPEDDPKITVEIYERTQEQNEEMGIADMNVDNYMDNQN